MADSLVLTGSEKTFSPDQIIVSKTDTKGRITYANQLFLSIAEYTEKDVLGQPHSMIRHPAMPRCIFELLWRTIAAGDEIFAYVVNRTKQQNHYWVMAHVTAQRDENGQITGYHSSRRCPSRAALEIIKPLYARLLAAEQQHSNDKQGLQAGRTMLEDILHQSGKRYDQFVFDLIRLPLEQHLYQ